MSEVIITYSGINIFEGIGPTPLVSLSTENTYENTPLYTIDKIVLNGRIKRDNCSTSGISDPYEKLKQLISKLNKPFQGLKIEEISNGQNKIIYDWKYSILKNFSIDKNNWYDWIPYSIEFDCYKGIFFENNRIINPTRKIDAKNNEDGTVSLSISCSCNGLNKDNQAIEYARKFVYDNSILTQSDINNLYWTADILKESIPYNISEQETFDRLNGSVEVSRDYIIQDKSLGFSRGIVLFQRSISTKDDGEYIVSINGSIQGNKREDTTLLQIEDDIKKYDWYSIGNELYRNSTNEDSNLYKSPVNFSLQRSPNENSVNFSIEYSNKKFNDIYIIDQTTTNFNKESGLDCIDISLEIRSDLKCENLRWDKITEYYNSFDFLDYVEKKWLKYGTKSKLNLSTNETTYSEDKFNGSISIQGKFCAGIGQDCGCLKNIKYSYSFVPPLNEYKVSLPVNGEGCHYIENLLVLKRASFSIRGNITQSLCCSYQRTVFELKNRINQIANSIFYGENKILDSIQISQADPVGEINFDFSWSAKKDKIIPDHIVEPEN